MTDNTYSQDHGKTNIHQDGLIIGAMIATLPTGNRYRDRLAMNKLTRTDWLIIAVFSVAGVLLLV